MGEGTNSQVFRFNFSRRDDDDEAKAIDEDRQRHQLCRIYLENSENILRIPILIVIADENGCVLLFSALRITMQSNTFVSLWILRWMLNLMGNG